tara:strand:+ start:33 stop:764 length:732 start_codon:yes stop_codon:yes gene_type:complete
MIKFLKISLRKLTYRLAVLVGGKNYLKRKILNEEERQLVKLQDLDYLRNNNFNSSYLQDTGWINSAIKKEIVDRDNSPLPWMTYPFINFLEPRLMRSFKIFEYGSGNSTKFFSSKVGYIYSVEHDRAWFEKIKNNLGENVELRHEELIYGGAYSQKALTIKEKFDIIIVDGRDRVNCCKNSLEALNDQGVVVLDNSNRPNYKPAIEFFTDNGFKKIDFTGMSPKSPQLSQTTLFYRETNCLNV